MNVHYGEVFVLKKKKKCGSDIGIAFVMFAVGLITVCIFPSEWIVVFTACMLVTAGIILMRR